MALEEREGVLEVATERGIVLSGERLSYSKWFEGKRLGVSALGCKVRILVDVGPKWSFVKRVLWVGEKPPGGTAPAEGRWPGRRMSPEELELKRAEGVRIARVCAVERAVEMAGRGVSVEEIASRVRLLEEYFLTGKLPEGEEVSSGRPPRRLQTRAVNALFNEARGAGIVSDWKGYEALIRQVLGGETKSAYELGPEEFAKVESYVRPRLRSA